MENQGYVQGIDLMEVSPSDVSVFVDNHGTFATVKIKVGRTQITLFTGNANEAREIVAKFVMPTVRDCQ